MADLTDLLCYVFRYRVYAFGISVSEIVGRVALPQRYCYAVIAGSHQVVHDLTVGALNGGNDGDNGCDAYDHAQHGQERAHLMCPDSLKGKSEIFTHVSLLSY